jgi:two-component system, OmpR family, phosphate regulon sensor histidine kinase PhoR
MHRMTAEASPSAALCADGETDAHREVDALLTQLKQLWAIFDSMQALVYVADMHTHEMLFLNSYGQKLFSAESLGQPCYRVLQSGQSSACAFCTNHRLVRDGKPQPPYVWEFQNTVTRKWFQCIDRAIHWTDGRLVRLEVAVDISERKDAEQLRKHYVHTVSHDLRTPLAVIDGRAQVLKKLRAQHAGATEQQCIDAILTATRRMNAMMADLADSARLESGQMTLRKRQVDLASFVSNALEHTAGALEVERVSLEAEPGLPPAHADPDHLERILINLLSNALKYSAAPTPVLVRVAQRGEELLVSVRDRGGGIHPEDLPHIFDRFHRGKHTSAQSGLGLGLYITRMQVEAHGGRISVDTEVGKGSAFEFTLPTASLAAHDGTASETPQ